MAYCRNLSKMAIKDYQGLSRTIKDYQGLSRTVKDCQGLSRIVKDCQGLSRIVEDCQGLSMFNSFIEFQKLFLFNIILDLH